MGRNCGYLALAAGIAGGAEAIVMPEVAMEPEDVIDAWAKSIEVGSATGKLLCQVGSGGCKDVAAMEGEAFGPEAVVRRG